MENLSTLFASPSTLGRVLRTLCYHAKHSSVPAREGDLEYLLLASAAECLADKRARADRDQRAANRALAKKAALKRLER